MELKPAQRRTLDQLIERAPSWDPPDGLDESLRSRLETEAAAAGVSGDVYLAKSRINKLDQCAGMFAADLAGETPPFEHKPATMVGNLVHKSVELDVALREPANPYELAERAAARLGDDGAFAKVWRAMGADEQDELLAETVRQIELFTATFPPLRLLRDRLRPVSEMPIRVDLAGGAVKLSGRVDLALMPDTGRVLLDLKTQDAWPEHAEDMRLYALLATLRFGLPPARVATVYLASGSWQPEESSQEMLERATDRVVAALRAAGEAGDPVLTPGVHCRWCPRGDICPESTTRLT